MARLEFWDRGSPGAITTGVRILLTDLCAATAWLDDESRRGVYTFSRRGRAEADGEAFFWFTDRGLSMEFRLRWGQPEHSD